LRDSFATTWRQPALPVAQSLPTVDFAQLAVWQNHSARKLRLRSVTSPSCRHVRHNVMETVKRQTESYLFQNSEGQFRSIPFYELSIDEWVVYEKGIPKYLIDFNRRQMPLIQDIKTKLQNGEDLEETVWKLGR